MTLHRTPVHHTVLSQVQAGKIEWRPSQGPYGRYARLGGFVIADPGVLVALYELERGGLIRKCSESGVVSATEAGRRRLAEWSVAR